MGFSTDSGTGEAAMAFVRTVKVDELPEGTVRELMVEGKAIALANIGGRFYAINNTCLHRGGPLGQGPLEGRVVTCPWHAWQYDMTTGKVVQNPSVGVDCYATELRGQDVFVEVNF
jgi:nitrite reductase (NADH) small subunit